MPWWTNDDVRQTIELRCDTCGAQHTLYVHKVIYYYLGLGKGNPMGGWQNINGGIYCPKCVTKEDAE